MITQSIIQNRIAEAIKQSGMSQTEISKELGLSQQVISDYLYGKKMPALDTFANFCKVLDADPIYILGLN